MTRRFIPGRRKDDLALSSEIARQGRALFALHTRVPAAWYVEQAHTYREHEVQEWEAPRVTRGSGPRIHWMIAEQPRVDTAFAHQRHDAGCRVDEGNVQEVIEEGHSPEDRQHSGDAPAPMLREREGDEHRTQGH